MAAGSMIRKNITGTVDKAYILLHSQAYDMSGSNNEDINSKTDKAFSAVASMGQKLMAAAGRATGQEADLSGLAKLAEENDFVRVKVQYNPNTLRFTSRGGKSFNRYSGVGGNASGQFQVDSVPYEVVLNMDLIFDDTVNSDAFMLDNGAYSPTGLAKRGASAIYDKVKTGSFGGNHSVQDISELFIAATTTAYSRIVCVVWNKTIFWGELCGVTVEYTMFNSAGNPIRSKVHLEIRQDARGATSDSSASWSRSYDQMFKQAKKLSSSKKLTGSGSMASNIFHLN